MDFINFPVIYSKVMHAQKHFFQRAPYFANSDLKELTLLISNGFQFIHYCKLVRNSSSCY